MTPPDGDRLRIGELAAVSGVPVRTIRYYHQQGVLPRPRMQGRVGWYDGEHLARLRQVRTLQDRGYSLAAVGDMIRSGVPGILFDAVPDGDPVAAVWPGGDIGTGQLQTVLGPAWDPALPDAMVALGLLEPLSDGDGDGAFAVPQPALLRAGLALVTRGVPLAVALGELTTLRTEMAAVADRFAGIVERDMLPDTGTTPVTRQQAGELLDDVLPAVLVAVGRLLADAVRDAVGERVGGRGTEQRGAQAG